MFICCCQFGDTVFTFLTFSAGPDSDAFLSTAEAINAPIIRIISILICLYFYLALRVIHKVAVFRISGDQGVASSQQ